MKDQCCKNCHYLFEYQVDNEKTYECKYHQLKNGEVNRPEEQKCDDWYSKVAKLRYDKLEKIGIK